MTILHIHKDINIDIEQATDMFAAMHPRGGSRAAATSKMERFVIKVNGWKPLTIITKCSILDFAAALDPPPHPRRMRMTNFSDEG